MDILAIIQGAFSPLVMLYAALGVVIGVTAGAIPGISGTTVIALTIPFAFKMPSACALAFFIGCYKGSMFGGSISAISFGIPGTPAAVATCFDGVPARKKGKPRQALLTALFSSVTGDVVSDLVLIFLCMPLASIALKFGPSEFVALYVFSLLLVAVLTEGRASKAIVMMALGLLIACIGSDPVTGSARFTFGIAKLRGGINTVSLLIGMFAMSEVITQLYSEWLKVRGKTSEPERKVVEIKNYDPKKDKMTFKTYLSTLKSTFIGATVGTFVGTLPAAGSSLSALMSYGLARRFSKKPDEFGKGSLEGIAAPEAANSATCGACFIPMFAFGIPGTTTAALFMVALMMMGISCGPNMLAEHGSVMYTFFVTMLYCNIFNLICSYFLIPIYAKISQLPIRYLVPAVCVLAIIGGYAAQNSLFDVILMLIFAFMGVYFKKHNFPTGPLILGFIIGTGLERSFSQVLSISAGNIWALFKSPIAIGIYVCGILFMFLMLYFFKSSNKLKEEATKNSEAGDDIGEVLSDE